MTSTSHPLLQNTSSRPSRLIENYQQSFIPRRMPQATRKNEQDLLNHDDKQQTPPLPPRSKDLQKSSEQSGEFPPKGGISSMLKTTPNASVLTQRYQYSRSSTSNSGGSSGRLFSSLPRRVSSDKSKNNSQVIEAGSHIRSTEQGVNNHFRDNHQRSELVNTSVKGTSKDKVKISHDYQSEAGTVSNIADVPPQIPPRGLTRRVTNNDLPSSPSRTDSSLSPIESAATPEPQPLTRTNVTKHDTIWTVDKETDEGVSELLSPPLKHLTPEITAEMIQKFDPHDVLDSASDSSADTMIMMTTEEERRNEESIHHSMQKYESKKSCPDQELTVIPDVSNSIISKGNGDRSHLKVTFMSPKRQMSEEESVDDGYGTNSSSGTSLSSPLSSSSSSSTTNSDLENSCNHGNNNKQELKSSIGKNGPIIKPSLTSGQLGTRNTWAVRRRNKMAESQDNSLQEKLRQLAIIEEEENNQSALESAGTPKPHTISVDNNSYERNYMYEKGPDGEPETRLELRNSRESRLSENTTMGPPEDLRRFEGDLCDKFTDMDRNYRNYYDFDKTNENLKEDSKVLYFHQKMLKQNYGSDNYYNPHPHRNSQNINHHDTPMQPPSCSGVPTLSVKNMVSMDTMGPNSSRSDFGGRLPYGGDITSRSLSYQSNSSGVSSMGNVSMVSDFVTSNTSCDNIFANGGVEGMPHKGRFISVDNVNQNGKRTFFASSADIYNMFQSGNNLATQIHRPASYRHSFHEMPSGNITADSSQVQPEQRPRAASTSVTLPSKSSWSLFGSMFGKKKNKNMQQKAENSSETQKKSSSNVQNQNKDSLKTSGKKSTQNSKIYPKEPSKPVPPPPTSRSTHQYTVVPVIRTPKAQQMRTQPTVSGMSHDSGSWMKSQTLPARGSYDHSIYEGRFKTVTTDEGNSQKLSTLV